jgi:hypothetical protein
MRPADYEGEHYIFIVGSPRSGTTVTAETLSAHPDVAYLYEPYYLWNYRSGSGTDDQRSAAHATDETRAFVRRHCHAFWKRSGAQYVVEQSPEESLMLPLIQRTLPKARFIHAIRDGYDCVRSIAHEWHRRAKSVESRSPLEASARALGTLARQPLWRFRALQAAFELKESGVFSPGKWTNKSKWHGRPGWGIRIPGWEKTLEEDGSLALNALQWSYTVERLMEGFAGPPAVAHFELRYEKLVTEPEAVVKELQEWLGLRHEPELHARVRRNPPAQGRRQSQDELAVITPRIRDVMQRLGYPILEHP